VLGAPDAISCCCVKWSNACRIEGNVDLNNDKEELKLLEFGDANISEV
jgi:hypothetical protein